MKVFVGACLLITIAGCKAKPAAEAPGPSGTSSSALSPVVPTATTPLDPATLGSVGGVIKFSGKAPAPVRIDTSMDPACGLGGGGNVFSEQYVVSAGKLANVFLYVKSGPAAAMNMGASGAPPVVMDQKNCRYTPHVVGVVQGGTVRFTNSDPTMHNIHDQATAAADQVDVSQGPRGAPVNQVFKTPEIMIPVRCNNHPWMNAFVNVSTTPFFAVSDAGGKFQIDGLPAGTYLLGAVHEKLGEQTMQVTVSPKSVAKADLAFGAK